MTSLDELSRKFSGDHRPRAEGTAAATRAAAAANALDQALIFAGLAPTEAKALVLVGLADDGRLLEAAFTRLPDLQAVLIFEPERRNLAPLLARAVEGGWGAVDPGRCIVAEPSEPGDGAPGWSLYRQLFQFFRACNVRPSLALVLSDPGLEPTAAHGQAQAASRDFCSGFSAAFFAGNAPTVEIPTALLRATADSLFQQEERYHALKFYLRSQAISPRDDVAWRILECWGDLRCYDQVQRWLQQPVFPETFRQQLVPQIEAALDEQRAARTANLAANRTALTAHLPDCGGWLRDDPGGDFTIVELPPIPWLLTYDSGQKRVRRAPYFLLVRVEDDGVTELNPPADPQAIHRNMSPPGDRDPYHACVAGWVASWGAAHVLLWTDLATAIPGWHRVVNLIEPDTRALSLLLQTVDLSDRLLPDRVHLFLGEDAEGSFVRLLEDEPNHAIPGIWAGVGPTLQAQLARVAPRPGGSDRGQRSPDRGALPHHPSARRSWK